MKISLVGIAIFVPLSLATTVDAADRNSYTAKYERSVPAEPACNVVISSANDPNWSKLNDTGYRVICLQPGDYRSRGVINLTASGGPGNERWLRYYNGNDNGAHPVRQSGGERAIITALRFQGADHWIVRRITIDGGGGSSIGLEFSESANSDNNTVDSVLAENARSTLAAVFYSNDNNSIQNSVIRNCLATRDQDWVAIGLFGGPVGTRVVNNEAYGCTKSFYISEHMAAGTIVENNDMYVSPAQYTDCQGNYTTAGPCAAAELVMGMKAGGSSDNPVLITHNRLWGSRAADPSGICCGSGAGGDVVHFSNAWNDPARGTRYVLFSNNIVMDAQNGIGDWWDYTLNNTIVGNIIYNIRRHYSGHVSKAMMSNFLSNTQYYFNTVVDSDSWFEFGGGRNNDVRCNVVIDSGAATGGASSDTQVDNNVFYNTSSYTTGTNNMVMNSSSAANTAEYCFYRKLHTSPERTCIPKVKPATSSPHYRACTADLASRTGIGMGYRLF